jgi:hypothetical protein
MKISNGKIRLKNKVIDLSSLEIRQKSTEKDLENYYNSFISRVPEIEGYFQDTFSFNKAVEEASQTKRPKLVARETKYPFLWGSRSQFSPFSFFEPATRRLNDDYFTTAQCIVSMPLDKKTVTGQIEKPLDELLRADISEKFKKYVGYEGILEIPNDRNIAATKALTFHEALHYVIIRYLGKTGRSFANTFGGQNLSPLEKYQLENIAHERSVEILTDKLLSHDSDAQFENRWTHYSQNDNVINFANLSSALATGILGGTLLVSNPYLLPLAILPSRIKDYALKEYRNSKKQKVLTPISYPEFKI